MAHIFSLTRIHCPVRVGLGHADRGQLEHRAKLLLAFAKRVLGPLALGFVPKTDDGCDSAVLLQARGGRILDRKAGAILSPEHLLVATI